MAMIGDKNPIGRGMFWIIVITFLAIYAITIVIFTKYIPAPAHWKYGAPDGDEYISLFLLPLGIFISTGWIFFKLWSVIQPKPKLTS